MRMYVLDYIIFSGSEREVSMFSFKRLEPFLDKTTKNNQKWWATEIKAVIVDETKFKNVVEADKYAATKIGQQLKETFVENQNIALPLSALAFRIAYMEFENEMAWLGTYSNNCTGFKLSELFKK